MPGPGVMKPNGWLQLSLLSLVWLRRETSSSECQPSTTLARVLTLSFQGPCTWVSETIQKHHRGYHLPLSYLTPKLDSPLEEPE